MEKQRARKPEEKAVRKQSIILALRELLARSRHPLPSVNEIAREAGVSKGVIYFYFQSREEIFLSLYSQESSLFFDGMNRLLTSPHYDSAKARDFVVDYFCNNETFMYLGLMAPTIMESNVNAEFAFQFKQGIAGEVEKMARHWMEAEPGLRLETTRNFIMRYYYMGLMLWQHHHPADAIRQAFPERDLWLISGDLKEELSQSFDWLWNGMKQDRPEETPH